jgi:heme/copper-type cytochrome/quinol oxidase subunit 2
MDRRTNICLWVILLGLANFFLYTIVYLFLGGEAVTGEITPDGRYLLHPYAEVPRWIFIYSGVHGISIWLTVAAVLLAMLTLAKERIISSMRSSIVRGRTFITILATIITFTTVAATIYFILHFAAKFSTLDDPAVRPAPPAATASKAHDLPR